MAQRRNAKTSRDRSLGPWHRPGKWLVNPAYWNRDVLAERKAAPRRIKFIDCTVSEGDDCVGHQPNWNTRLGIIERLDEIGLGEITLPSHVTFQEELDLIKACRRMKIRTPLIAKGPGIKPPLKGNWRAIVDRHIDMGADAISPIYKWDYRDTITDFGAGLSKQAVMEAMRESIAYMKRQKIRVVPWIVDSMRSPVSTVVAFSKAMADAGTDGVYLVDSRGNSVPTATRAFVRAVREAIGPKVDLYVQHHNDLGVATANALADVEGGANWIDATVTGIGDRGGCVALEEAAVLFEMYGIATGIKLDRLYDLCRYVQKAYGISLPPWKPVAGANWNKEEGWGHLEGSTAAEATIGVSPEVVGRKFEAVIGAKILFGRERSSAHTDDPVFLRELLAHWKLRPSEPDFQTIVFRARAAVGTMHGRQYLTFDEFRAIADGVLKARRR